MFLPGKKFYCGCGATTSFKRLYQTASSNAQILSDMTGTHYVRAKRFVEKHKIQNKDGDLLVQTIKFCQNIGYTKEEILRTEGLLTKHPLQIEHNYLSLEEGGFDMIGPAVLAKARMYMKTPVTALKSLKLIKYGTKVPERLASFIEEEEIRKCIPLDCDESLFWTDIHMRIIQSYIKWRLNASEDEIIKLFRVHQMIKNKSLRVIQENIRIAEDLGYSHYRLLRCGYLLNNYPNYPKTTLRDFPNLAGTDMRAQMKQYPKLIMTPPRNIVKIYGILKSFDISDDVIARQMNVFHMSPATVKLRLEEIKRHPDLNVVFHHPSFLKLVVHLNRTKSRLTFLQQLPIKCASLSILKTDLNERFEEYVRDGKDINKPADVIDFLKNLFSPDLKIIHEQLRIHPFYLRVPLKEMKRTYDFLKKKNYKDSSIHKVVHILLYPIEKIESALLKMKCPPYNYLSQVSKLNLVLYLIEKDHHFTGNGIWIPADHPEVLEKTSE